MKKGLPFILGFAVFGVYLTTMNPTVSFIDTGELAAVAATLGIAHPTGYPLFTLAGRLFLTLPLPVEPITILNVVNAAVVAVAVVVFFRFLLMVSTSPIFSGKRGVGAGNDTFHWSAFAAALILGLSTTVWAQSVALEVYALHLLFIMMILVSFVRGLDETASIGALSPSLVLFSFLLGLSFGNHMTTLLLIPACAILLFRVLGWRKETWRIVARLSPFFLLGLSTYLYLPIRSASRPPLIWGDPVTLERVLWHISGKQYRSWIFSGFENTQKQFTYFLESFPDQFHWVCIALLVLGAYVLGRDRRPLLWFCLLLAGGCLAYAVNYDIHDIDSYFLLAFVASGVMVAFGLHALIGFLSRNLHRGIVVSLVILIVGAQWWLNRPRVDESDNYLVYDYSSSILRSVAPNAVIFSFQWDYFVSASYYYQVVRGERPDVVIIDKELLRRSWYFHQIERGTPWLIDRARPAVNRFLVELEKFERGLPYDPATIEAKFNEMVNALILSAMRDRPVYFGPEMEPQFAAEFRRRPEGLLLRIDPGAADSVGRAPEVFYRPTSFESRLTKGIKAQYATILTLHGIWLKNEGFPAEARKALQKASEIDPSYVPAKILLQRDDVPPAGK